MPTSRTLLEMTGTLSSDGDAVAGGKVANYDAESSATGLWNGTRRRLRGPSFSFNGNIRAAERAHFAIWVPRGARLTAEVFAERIGSNLDAILTVLEADGETVIAEADDTIGFDPSVSVIVSEQPSASQLIYLRCGDTRHRQGHIV